jgi:nucleoid DNA-binding protein
MTPWQVLKEARAFFILLHTRVESRVPGMRKEVWGDLVKKCMAKVEQALKDDDDAVITRVGQFDRNECGARNARFKTSYT